MKTRHLISMSPLAAGLVGVALLVPSGVAEEAGRKLELPVDGREIERVAVPTTTSFAPMLERATPAVVSVYTAEVVKVVRRSGSPRDELLRRFFGLPSPQPRGRVENEIEEQRVPQGVGSGVIVSRDGYILTNNHVVMDQGGDDADEVLVQLTDGRELVAEIIGRDPKSDVALIKVEAEDLPAIRIANSDQCRVGDIVFAIGNPMGVGITVTQGIVSATGRAIGIYGREGYEDFIQTDASINRGNSGGALVDIEGRLIGVNSAILSLTGGNMGIGFAIPSNMVANVARQLTAFGEVRRGFLGVAISEVSPDLAEAFGLKDSVGVVVDHVEEGSAAAKAGLERGDIVRTIDGKEMRDANDLRLHVAQQAPGSKIRMSIVREGKEMELETAVGDRANQLGGMGGEWLDGVEAALLTEESREEYGIPDGVGGMVIKRVAPNSPYVRHFEAGMVIVEVNDKPVSSLDDARKALRRGVNKLYAFSRGRTGYIALRVRE